MTNRILHLLIGLFIFSPIFCQLKINPENLSDINNVLEVSVSPSGNHVAYTVLVPRDIKDGIGYAYRELYVYDLNKGEIKSLIIGRNSISSISWQDDANVLFRQNTSETNGAQVFSLNIMNEKKNQITNFDRAINSYYSTNESTLIFSSDSEPSSEKQELKKQGIDIKVFEEELTHIELFRYNTKDKKAVPLFTGMTVYDFTVSPDGTKIAASVSEKQLVDYYYMFRKIYIIDAKTGKTLKKLDNPGKLGKLVWSPNSKHLAFISASDIHDAVVGSLFIMDTEDDLQTFADCINIVKELELSVIDVIWESENNLIYTAEAGVDISVTKYDISNNKHQTIIEGGEYVFREAQIHNENLYFAANTSEYPNELISFNIRNSQFTKHTDHNNWLKDISLAKQEKIVYNARDGKDIQGVLVYPIDYQEGKRYPLIVYIHGGPEAAVQNGWTSNYSTWGQFAAAKGFFVFSPNYRASSGRGVEFTMAGFGDLLGVEYDDVLDGIDFLIETGKVDKSRVGIGGGSYGGFFAAYSATKHSERFAASVVFVGISNQISKRKTTDIPYEDYYVHWGFWTHENFEKVWNASPVKYAANSQTPTLILHGEDDPRIPVSQGLELYRALKLHGKAPVRFVLYPGEGHGNGKNINRYDYLVRTLDWFEYYLITNVGSKDMPQKYLNYK
jgi:dipeptidyl aminopeptidase/acylaminoacyl peptidase